MIQVPVKIRNKTPPEIRLLLLCFPSQKQPTQAEKMRKTSFMRPCRGAFLFQSICQALRQSWQRPAVLLGTLTAARKRPGICPSARGCFSEANNRTCCTKNAVSQGTPIWPQDNVWILLSISIGEDLAKSQLKSEWGLPGPTQQERLR